MKVPLTPTRTLLIATFVASSIACNPQVDPLGEYRGGDTYTGGGGAGDIPSADEGAVVSACDACVNESCGPEADACAADPSCGAVEACRAGCSDDTCLDDCWDPDGASAATDQLDACTASSCASVCP